jgi:biotin carboxylase
MLVVPTTTYRCADFLAAADRLGVDLVIASEKSSTLEQLNPESFFLLDHQTPQQLAARVRRLAAERPLDAVVPVDSAAALDASLIARTLGLAGNGPDSVAAALDKLTMRRLLAAAGVPQPAFAPWRFDDDLARLTLDFGFPCVVKPLHLAASQGVMRADDRAQLEEAVERLRRIVARRPASDGAASLAEDTFLVEAFVPGWEYSLEGILTRGQLRTLALFDKPDPLDGPVFEETVYVTPSDLPAVEQEVLREVAQRACRALGLRHGPIHAELRRGPAGPVVIEVNARSIGGLCSRTLRFGLGASLEELILRHALDDDWQIPPRESSAAGVMMVPVPADGVLEDYAGIQEAEATEGIEQVAITAHRGEHLVRLPEGGRYLGFLFARGESRETVIESLRQAHQRLRFEIKKV